MKTGSGMERGTLYQIRNLIDRRNVKTKPKSDVNAAEDFLKVVVVGYIIGYIIAAVMTYLGMSSFSAESIVPHDIWMEDDAVRQAKIKDIAKHIVNEYVCLATEFKEHKSKPDSSYGTVLEYSREVLSLGILFLDFKDAVREGDGDRVLLVWKYLMLLFKASNYAIEALTLLSQYHLTLPPNLIEQLKWSRFININGIPGHNASCDLHMEHLNKLVKTAMEGLGANKSQKAICRVGRAIGVLASAIDSFDKDLGVPSGKHSDKAKKRIFILLSSSCWIVLYLKFCVLRFRNTIVMYTLILCRAKKYIFADIAFDPSSKKKHKSFSSLKANLIRTLNEQNVKA